MEGEGYESNCCRFRSEQGVTGRRSSTWDGEHTILFSRSLEEQRGQ